MSESLCGSSMFGTDRWGVNPMTAGMLTPHTQQSQTKSFPLLISTNTSNVNPNIINLKFFFSKFSLYLSHARLISYWVVVWWRFQSTKSIVITFSIIEWSFKLWHKYVLSYELGNISTLWTQCFRFETFRFDRKNHKYLSVF